MRADILREDAVDQLVEQRRRMRVWWKVGTLSGKPHQLFGPMHSMVFKPWDRPAPVEVQRRRRHERMGLRADGLQRWAVERLMEAKRLKSGGVWG